MNADKLANALRRATDFIGYLLDHLPEDKRDNSVWSDCKAALAEHDAQPAQAAQPVGVPDGLAQAMEKFVCSVGLIVESAKQSTKTPNACFVDWRDVCALRGEVDRLRAMRAALEAALKETP